MQVQIHRTKNEQFWALVIPALLVVGLASYNSAATGIATGAVIVVGCLVFSARLKAFVANPPVVLELNDRVFGIRRGWVKEVEIPWKDIEGTGLSYGGRRGVRLNIRVRDPAKYLSTFMRANLVLSHSHISVPVSGLECTPDEIIKKIEEARKAYA